MTHQACHTLNDGYWVAGGGFALLVEARARYLSL